MEVVFIVVVLIIIGLGVLAYFAISNDKLHKFINDSFNTNNNLGNNIDEFAYDINNSTPLNTDTFINTLNYADKKQDSRTDEVLKSIDKIVFWIRIIGLYILFKIVLFLLVIIKNTAILKLLFESMSELL